MIVLKFGGSSVDGAAGILKVVELIRARLAARPVVVVSAMAKTTRRLVAAGQAAAAGDLGTARQIAAEIADFHACEATPVTPPGSLEPIFAAYFRELDEALVHIADTAGTAAFESETAGGLAPCNEDRVAGFGELLSSAILALALARAGIDATCVDCRRVIVTDDRHTRARPDYGETDTRLQAALRPLLAAGGVPVLGGYVGATRAGVTTTLGREGSDFSAAIVGAALAADEVQLWTDVDGILSADPRLVAGARVVKTLSFGEALELACSGSKKPHPGTLEPASRANVPIRVLNSKNPEAGGTLIGRRAALVPPRILSLACRTAAYPLFVLPGVPEAPRVAPGRALISLVSEDLATSPELASRALEAARSHDREPRLVIGHAGNAGNAADTAGAAAPVIRLCVDEAAAPRVLAELHAALILDSLRRMNRLALVGYGRVGRLVGELAPEHGFQVVATFTAADNPAGSGLTAERLAGAEIAIDFSTAAAVPDNVLRLAALGIPVVVGTTGWGAELPRVRAAVEQAGTGFVYGANFSIGVQIFYRLAETAARLLAGADEYGAWAYEIHHVKKKDAPSGTLLELLRRVEGAGFGRGVDVASNRAGSIPGTHLLGFDSEADTITLEHRARSRVGYARGALKAARWLLGRPGVHEFAQIWEETL